MLSANEVTPRISVLCVNRNSIYKTIPGLDVWDEDRDAYNFKGTNQVITHAPCQQWSKMKSFAKDNPREKELAFFCLNKVMVNGGIFEHPAGSSFFKAANVPRSSIYSVDQFWWGLECKKPTWLFFSQCKPLPYALRFEAITHQIKTGFNGANKIKNGMKWMQKTRHSYTTIDFAKWLIASVENSIKAEESFRLYNDRYKIG